MSYFDDENVKNGSADSEAVQNNENAAGTQNDESVERVDNGGAYGVAYTPESDGGYRCTSYTPSAPAAAVGAVPAKKKGGKKKVVLTVLSIVLCVLLSGVAGFVGTYVADRYFDAETTEAPKNPAPHPSHGSSADIVVSVPSGSETKAPISVERGELMNYADAAAKVKDSVVEITTEATVQSNGYYPQYVTEGAGSGVIITATGYIVTNNHVVDGAEKITVRLTDGAEYPAALIGTDSRTDVAVIKIEPADRALTVAAFAEDSTKLVVGMEVLAIGNPLGELGGTVTNGIISALEREVKISGSGTMTLLQTNAAVNPGNSGGGLFNLYGELVGVVNAKSAGTNIEGLGFAIPANTVRNIASQLMENGYVTGRPSIGITVLELDAFSAYYYFRSNHAGIYVAESETDAIKYGDRILSVDGTEITDSDDVNAIIEKHEIGETIEVMLVRDRKTMTVSVTLTESVPENLK